MERSPLTGWNAQSLDDGTTEAYDAAVVLTPHGQPRVGPGPDGNETVLPDCLDELVRKEIGHCSVLQDCVGRR